MFTLFAVFEFEAIQKWMDHLSTSAMLTVGGLALIAIAMGLREVKENRIARDFGEK